MPLFAQVLGGRWANEYSRRARAFHHFTQANCLRRGDGSYNGLMGAREAEENEVKSRYRREQQPTRGKTRGTTRRGFPNSTAVVLLATSGVRMRNWQCAYNERAVMSCGLRSAVTRQAREQTRWFGGAIRAARGGHSRQAMASVAMRGANAGTCMRRACGRGCGRGRGGGAGGCGVVGEDERAAEGRLRSGGVVRT